MAGPNDINAKECILGDSIQITPVADPYNTSKVIGIIDDIQTGSAAAVGLVHVTYPSGNDDGGPSTNPRGTTPNRWSEWTVAALGTIIQRKAGTAP